MKKRETILLIVIVIVFLALWFWHSASVHVIQAEKSSLPATHAPTITPQSVVTLQDDSSPLSLKAMSKEEALKIYIERSSKDTDYDWKRPLDFYGKVVDENDKPIAGATAHFEWTTIGTPGNGAEAETLSDGSGLFSLTKQHGKVLEVRVEKSGYYIVDGGKGGLAFEYADPSNQDYYEADSSNPVIFHLRKKGIGAVLVNKEVDLVLEHDHPQNGVNLLTGRIAPDGTLQIEANKPEYHEARGHYAWSVTLSISQGGLVETHDQFPFQAPESGYVSTVVMDMTQTDQPSWGNMMTKSYYFYLSSSNTYGRMTVDTLGASRHVEIDYFYNSTPGSRYLEPVSK